MTYEYLPSNCQATKKLMFTVIVWIHQFEREIQWPSLFIITHFNNQLYHTLRYLVQKTFILFNQHFTNLEYRRYNEHSWIVPYEKFVYKYCELSLFKPMRWLYVWWVNKRTISPNCHLALEKSYITSAPHFASSWLMVCTSCLYGLSLWDTLSGNHKF